MFIRCWFYCSLLVLVAGCKTREKNVTNNSRKAVFVPRSDSLPLAVGERDALRRHLEVDGGGVREGVGGQRLTDGLGDGLRPREGLHVHRVDVEDVARWRETKQKTERLLNKSSRGEGISVHAAEREVTEDAVEVRVSCSTQSVTFRSTINVVHAHVPR